LSQQKGLTSFFSDFILYSRAVWKLNGMKLFLTRGGVSTLWTRRPSTRSPLYTRRKCTKYG